MHADVPAKPSSVVEYKLANSSPIARELIHQLFEENKSIAAVPVGYIFAKGNVVSYSIGTDELARIRDHLGLLGIATEVVTEKGVAPDALGDAVKADIARRGHLDVNKGELTDEKYERIQRIRRLVHLESDKFIQKHFKVPDDATGRPLDFKFRWAQQRAYDIYKEELRSGKPVRLWFLKSRRVGLTSIFAADDLLDAWANENKRVGIVAHNDERARRILAICKFYYKRMPPSLRVPLSKDATAGLKFADHDSELVIGTCREPAKIRGDGLQRAHLSEAAWYGNNFSRVMQEVAMTVAPEPGTAIIIETTGRDRGSSCHKHWAAARAGENQYRAEFIPWIEDPTASTTFDSDMHASFSTSCLLLSQGFTRNVASIN